MARVTVEDCLKIITNRFKLTLLVSRRAAQLLKGAEPFVAANHDRPVVLALREVAAGMASRFDSEAVIVKPAKVNEVFDEGAESADDADDADLAETTVSEANSSSDADLTE